MFCTELIFQSSLHLFLRLIYLKYCPCRYWNQVLLNEGAMKGNHPCFIAWFDLEGEKSMLSGKQLDSWSQGCHKGRFWRKITIQTSARIRVYPADAVFPADGFLPSADAVKTTSARTQPNVRADMGVRSAPMSLPPSPPLPSPLSLLPLCCTRGREKNNNNKFFLVVVAGLEREKKFTIFGFRFEIPKTPKIPELAALRGLRGRSRNKQKVFLA
jgi:hypothetical protein